MSTFNITLNNPSADAVRALVQEMDRVKRDNVKVVSFDYDKIEKRVLSHYGMDYGMSAKKMSEVVSRVLAPKKAYIFDLDGVIADHKHRLHYIDGTDGKKCKCGHPEKLHHHSVENYLNVGCLREDGRFPHNKFCPCKKFRPGYGRNWTGYFKHMVDDTPIEENIVTLKALAQNFKIVFITGRPESTTTSTVDFRKVTEDWIKQHVGITDYELWMRPRGNFKPNAELKRQLVLDHVRKDDVRGVFEDNPEAVQMYRSLGMTVYEIDGGWDTENN